MSVERAYPGRGNARRALTASQSVPSGQAVELYEVLIDEVGGENWLRFRFIAPDIARIENTLSFDEMQSDFDHLCTAVALPYMNTFDLMADVVVIALLDRPVTFGETDPEATQLIEAFRVNGDLCEVDGLW